MKNENKLTWSKPDGTWGLKNYDIKKVPGELQGALYKLHDYEKTGLSPDEVESMKEESGGWIPCSKRLPEEPIEIPPDTVELENMIERDKIQEYIVTMYGGEKATTLYYAGRGDWYDMVTQEYYDVLAWQPLPDQYIPEGDKQ